MDIEKLEEELAKASEQLRGSAGRTRVDRKAIG